MKKQAGFTLLEVLIALVVFAIIASITSSAMYYAFNTRARLKIQADRLSHLQTGLVILSRDTRQIIDRSVRGNDMVIYTGLIGQKDSVEFTRGGLVNPNSLERRSTLQRIALICRDKQLFRRRWDLLDTLDRNRYKESVLIENLADCDFKYINHQGQVLNDWNAQAIHQEEQLEPLPKAIQLNLNLADWGKGTFLFLIPESVYSD